MTPQELKASILQLAIQGKLVEQRPEEGTGAELLAKILATTNTKGTKKNSHAESRSRGERAAFAASSSPSCPVSPSSPVPPADAPFDIPESWVWVRLGEVVSNHGQKKPTGDFSYIDIGSIDNKNQRLSDSETIVHAENASPRARKIVQKGDVIYATVRPYLHNVCVIDREFSREPIASTGFAVMACADCLDNKSLFYFLLSPDFDRYANSSENAKGVAYPAISDKRLYNAPIPLPPLAEQKRIVAKIEELLPYIDRYEKAWSKLEDFNKRFPGDMQKSLLQMAIQGKLVDQRHEEGTGAELLAKILAEKGAKGASRSCASKKAGKAGAVAGTTGTTGTTGTGASLGCPVRPGGLGGLGCPVPPADAPFDIPESWVWVRLGEIGSWASGATPSRTHAEYFGGSIPWLKTGDLNDGCLSSIPETITDLALEKTSVRLNPIGSVLMAMYGATIGKLGILQIAATTNQACCACIPYDGVWNKYLFYYLMARRKAFIKMGEGGAQPNISKEKIVNALFPLPPLAEQKRIAAKLEELLPLCERLK